MIDHDTGDSRCKHYNPHKAQEGFTYNCTMCTPVTCPQCEWKITGPHNEVLPGLRAHGLLEHGRKPLQWRSTPEGGLRT